MKRGQLAHVDRAAGRAPSRQRYTGVAMGVASTLVVLFAALALGFMSALHGDHRRTMRRFLEDDGGDEDGDDALEGCEIETVGCFTVRLRPSPALPCPKRSISLGAKCNSGPSGRLRRRGVPQPAVWRRRLLRPGHDARAHALAGVRPAQADQRALRPVLLRLAQRALR